MTVGNEVAEQKKHFGNNPIKYNDPSGYFITFAIGLAMAAAAEHIAVTAFALLNQRDKFKLHSENG